MERIIAYFSWDRLYNYFGMLAGFVFSALGGWDAPLRLLVAAMALDYLSGVLAAIKEKKLSSAVGFHGLARKLTVFLLIVLASALDALTGSAPACRSAAILFYFVNEAVSLAENASRLGVPVPEKLKEVLEQLRGGEVR